MFIHDVLACFSLFQALAWCPWQPTLLATGGGTADRCIRFWNVTTGSCLQTVDTNSQVRYQVMGQTQCNQ